MKSEANMRKVFGLSNTQPITASLYAASQQLKNVAIAGTNAVKTSGALTAGSVAVTVSAAAGPMFLLGMAIGTGYAVCKSIKLKINKYQRRISEINQVLEIALSSMRDAYNALDETMKRTFDFWDQQFEQGFTNMMEALVTNGFVSFSTGLNTIINVFGSNVLFKSMDEFDNFFFDDSAVLTL